MHFAALALTLLPLAAAIDNRFFLNSNDCIGAFASCPDINPGICCTTGAVTYGSVSFEPIPSNWNIWTHSFDGGGCGRRLARVQSNHNTAVCHGGGRFTGLSYDFVNRKRRVAAALRDVGDEDCVRANNLVLADGAVYDLDGVEDTVYAEMSVLSRLFVKITQERCSSSAIWSPSATNSSNSTDTHGNQMLTNLCLSYSIEVVGTNNVTAPELESEFGSALFERKR
ncbi:uncharacterized protein B0I36DRAFT_354425 [Microdochium trichocladiopsis]|uniref:Uncharacterized protein n=1 Tax=Microdochium trichocladiopsis TaxID=1682393 RepID=A0A9P8XU22_9PEZI|nr:uncharacterized protein B0I36DRAFT_354425 [Microdochium trichocladiopsis]KAH7018113.1 hypothetical protein B0I36DRAFT_354425 [Microdochium trichocladiopsis]